MTIQVLDLILALFLTVSAYLAARRGFIEETLSIVGWVLAIFATLYFGPWAAQALRHSISPAWIGTVAGYGAVFLVVLLAVLFVTSWISHDAKHSRMGPVDGILGAAFGLVRGLVIIGFLYLMFSVVIPPRHQPDWIAKAQFLPVIRTSADILVALVPSDTWRKHLAPAKDVGPDDAAPAGKTAARPEAQDDEAVAQSPENAENRTRKERENKAVTTEAEDYKMVIPRIRPKFQGKPTVAPPAAKHRKAGYGETDRKALDRLIEKNGSRGNR
jgi:membrane protein required for colicin V production